MRWSKYFGTVYDMVEVVRIVSDLNIGEASFKVLQVDVTRIKWEPFAALVLTRWVLASQTHNWLVSQSIYNSEGIEAS